MFPSPGGAYPPPEELFAGRYAVDGTLPWGGVASYYRAHSEGTPLILCVLPIDLSRSKGAEAAFSELAHGLGSLRAVAVPRVLDAGIIDGVPYLAFRDMRGTVLGTLLRDRPMSSLNVLCLASEVLDALGAAHAQGLAHGDLTPQNIVVSRRQNGRLGAKLIGLGIVPLIRSFPEASPHAAHTGSGRHAVAYMAPELFGGGTSSPSADLYAVGALLHHMVLGAPRMGVDANEGFDDIPGLPEVIGRAMASHPQNRYTDASAMRAALDWLEVESAKQNPRTQDIAPWMETSNIGSIPVPSLNSPLPPAFASSSHPPGTLVGRSGARPIPIKPTRVDEVRSDRTSRWRQIALLSLLLAGLLYAGYRWDAGHGHDDLTLPLGLDPGAQHGE
jgi:serine/threonine-protein kinase